MLKTNAQSLSTYQITPKTCFLHTHRHWNMSVAGGGERLQDTILPQWWYFISHHKMQEFGPHPDSGCNGVKTRQTWWNKTKNRGMEMPAENWWLNETQIAFTSKGFFKPYTPIELFKTSTAWQFTECNSSWRTLPFHLSSELCWKLGLFPRHNRFPKHVTVSVWLPVATIVSSQTVKIWIKITRWELK